MLKSYIESLAFQPPPTSYIEHDSRLSWVRISQSQDIRIPVFFVPSPRVNPNTLTIVYSHGNGEDLGELMEYFQDMAERLLVNVVGYDYVGYGPKRTTRPSEAGAYASVESTVKWVRDVKRIPISNIILFGRSLGGGPTCHAASVFKEVAGVILQSTFTSAARIVVDLSVFDWMMGDIFINQNKIPYFKGRILLIHGRDDEVVPFEHSQRLEEMCKKNKNAIVETLFLSEAGHNNIETRHHVVLFRTLENFINSLK